MSNNIDKYFDSSSNNFILDNKYFNNSHQFDVSCHLLLDNQYIIREPIISFSNSIDSDTDTSFCSNIKKSKQKNSQAKIQNQVGVSQSLKNSVLKSLHYNNFDSSLNSNSIWGNPYNLRNQSDRPEPAGNNRIINNSRQANNKPGQGYSGGKGVDVKHGSYDRYLAKLRRKTIQGTLNDLHDKVNQNHSINNKNYIFNILKTNCNICNN